MRKNKELFFFFGITNATAFKAKLKSDILPLVTTTTQLLDNTTQPTTALNIAFSQTGLQALNVTDSLGDSVFSGGQAADNGTLGDPGTVNWVPQFVGTNIHGVILLASDTVDNVNAELANVQSALGDSISEIYSLQAAARPGLEQGHEREDFILGACKCLIFFYARFRVPGRDLEPRCRGFPAPEAWTGGCSRRRNPGRRERRQPEFVTAFVGQGWLVPRIPATQTARARVQQVFDRQSYPQ
jgi:hypothetical protein